jgi:NDP-sugar pyrophosphorylase family protein
MLNDRPYPATNLAVILAAGRGTRMRNLTDDKPKPMIEVQGKPILRHITEGLRDAGVTRFLIVTGYRAELIEDYFGDGSVLGEGISVEYVRQVVQDGTGRVVELAKDFSAGEPFVLSYGDILVDPQVYKDLLEPRAATGVLTIKLNEDVSKGGAVFIDDERFVTDLKEKPAPGEATSPWYNAGLYLFPGNVFTYTGRLEKSPRGEYELTSAISDMAQSGEKIYALEILGNWADVRDPEVLAELNG